MSNDPFASAGSSGVRITDYEGQLLLITPTEYITGIKTEYNDDKDAVLADFVVLDGKNKGEENSGVYVFPGKLIGALKRRIGANPNMVLGRLGKSKEKTKGNAAWILEPPTEADKKLAREHLAKQPQDPFA